MNDERPASGWQAPPRGKGRYHWFYRGRFQSACGKGWRDSERPLTPSATVRAWDADQDRPGGPKFKGGWRYMCRRCAHAEDIIEGRA